MRDRRAGIAAHVADTRLQQLFRDREDTLAAKHLPLPVTELFDLLGERAFAHTSVARRLRRSVATSVVDHALALLVPDGIAARVEENRERTTEIELVLRRGVDELGTARAGLRHARSGPELQWIIRGEPAGCKQLSHPLTDMRVVQALSPIVAIDAARRGHRIGSPSVGDTPGAVKAPSERVAGQDQA